MCYSHRKDENSTSDASIGYFSRAVAYSSIVKICCWYLASLVFMKRIKVAYKIHNPYFLLLSTFLFLSSSLHINMTTLVTLVLSNADKLPIVGSPINHATSWYRKRSHSQGSDLETPPPPPYENEPVVHSRLTQISDYVWKRASFSSNTASSSNRAPESYTALPSKEEPFNKEKITEGISLIQMATEMNNAPNGKNQQVSVDLYMMGLDKILASLPSK